MWLSLVERYIRDVEVASSNLVIQISMGYIIKQNPVMSPSGKGMMKRLSLLNIAEAVFWFARHGRALTGTSPEHA